MSQWKFRCGDQVLHNFSKVLGTIIDTRVDPKGYCYQVVWEDGRLLDNPDWYKENVLERLDEEQS